jgi:hypothetical protein
LDDALAEDEQIDAQDHTAQTQLERAIDRDWIWPHGGTKKNKNKGSQKE